MWWALAHVGVWRSSGRDVAWLRFGCGVAQVWGGVAQVGVWRSSGWGVAKLRFVVA
jgi:hypothetical protein